MSNIDKNSLDFLEKMIYDNDCLRFQSG